MTTVSWFENILTEKVSLNSSIRVHDICFNSSTWTQFFSPLKYKSYNICFRVKSSWNILKKISDNIGKNTELTSKCCFTVHVKVFTTMPVLKFNRFNDIALFTFPDTSNSIRYSKPKRGIISARSFSNKI